MPVTTPTNLITEPFGASAVDITLPVPITDPGSGQASFTLGFPHVNKLPVNTGGIPPYLEDMNGILNMVTAYAAALGAGQIFPYSSALATAIGGFKQGAILAQASGAGFWLNLTNGNTSNPDTGGAGWVPLYTYGIATVPVTGGVVTLTTAQAACETIIFTGTLTTDCAVVVPPVVRRWTFVNNTTAGLSFQITIQSALGHAAATLQQPDSINPLSVCTGVRGDGTNCYNEFAPLFSPQFYGSPTCALGTIGGNAFQVINQQYLRDVLLSSPALGGTPTAATASFGTNNTQIATTAFVQAALVPSSHLATTGHRISPDGYIEQWGPIAAGAGINPVDIAITFDIPFPHECFHVSVTTNRSVATAGQAGSGSNFALGYRGAGPTSGCTVTIDDSLGSASAYAGTYYAVGW